MSKFICYILGLCLVALLVLRMSMASIHVVFFRSPKKGLFHVTCSLFPKFWTDWKVWWCTSICTKIMVITDFTFGLCFYISYFNLDRMYMYMKINSMKCKQICKFLYCLDLTGLLTLFWEIISFTSNILNYSSSIVYMRHFLHI